MKKRTFDAELLDGHKGTAFLVPFDPQEAWGRPPVKVASVAYGISPGFLVRGTMNDHPFEGWIGNRRGRFFILVDDALRTAAGLEVGGSVRVAVELMPAAPAKARRKPTPKPKPRRRL